MFDPPKLDEIMMRCIDKIWDVYDDDGNGYLDREETRAFIQSSLKGEPDPNDKEEDEEDDENSITNQKYFEACFRRVDEDNSGVISKMEMLKFLKIVAELDEDEENL